MRWVMGGTSTKSILIFLVWEDIRMLPGERFPRYLIVQFNLAGLVPHTAISVIH